MLTSTQHGDRTRSRPQTLIGLRDRTRYAIPQTGIFKGIQLGGKSGTAQVGHISMASRLSGACKRKNRPWEQLDHALFVAFALFDAACCSVGVIVEDDEGVAKVAGPVARDLIMKALESDHAAARARRPRPTLPPREPA